MPAVWLRPWRASDAVQVAEMAADEHVQRWSALGADVDAWLAGEVAQACGPTRAICVPGEDRALGRVAFRPPGHASDAVTSAGITQADQPAGELSYWLLPAARGRGLAQAGVEAMLETIVNPMGLRSAVLDIEPSNVPSVRLAGRIGAERREPPRIATDRTRIQRTLVVYVVRLPWRRSGA